MLLHTLRTMAACIVFWPEQSSFACCHPLCVLCHALLWLWHVVQETHVHNVQALLPAVTPSIHLITWKFDPPSAAWVMQVRKLIQQGFHQALEQVDVLVGPSAPCAAFELGTVVNDPLQMYKADLLTVGLNLAGGPPLLACIQNSLSVPKTRVLQLCMIITCESDDNHAHIW